MIKSFQDADTELLWNTGKSRRIPASLRKVASRKLAWLDSATSSIIFVCLRQIIWKLSPETVKASTAFASTINIVSVFAGWATTPTM